MIRLMEAAGSGTPLYQLKITLRDCKPLIWRKVVVRADMRLDRLHRVFQIVMGWMDSHLHQFVVGSITYGQPDREWDVEETKMLNEKHHTVIDLVMAKEAGFIYEYDFGDGWEHDVAVEKVLSPDPSFKHPICLDGANACPPEDCGGSFGYADFVKAMANPKHPDHEQMKEWIGTDWNPKLFSIDRVNAKLRKLKA